MSIAKYSRPHLADCIPDLVAFARGERKASLFIKGGSLVNVVSGEILYDTSVAVVGTRIAYVGPFVEGMTGPETIVVDAQGKYIAPGLLDGHCHIESSMLSVTQFANAVLPLGTTGGFFDPHEISNVLGLPGLRIMLDEARQTPMAAYMQVASCVPATSSEFETSGAEFGPEEVAEALSWGPDMIALGEVMNFPGVVFGDPKMIGEIQATLRAGKLVDGHYTWPSNDPRLSAYAAAGVTGCHESITKEDAAARVRLGIYAKLRRGSAWHDVEATIKAHTEMGLDTRRMMLVSDDRICDSIKEEGHMNFIVRHAIQQGVKPVTAFQMATLNTAERFGVARDVGSVTPGSIADIILLDGHLADVNVVMTIAAGQVVAENGKMTIGLEPFQYPEYAVNSVKLAKPLTASDFAIEAPVSSGTVKARVVEVIENNVETNEVLRDVPVEEGKVVLTPDSGLSKMALFERHGKTGGSAIGLAGNIGFNVPAAISMTVAHDSHNVLVIGNDDELMANAANAVIGMQGGIAVATANGIVQLPLRLAGLMSTEPYETVVEQMKQISSALIQAGCTMNYAFMTLSLIALVVIPTLHISDTGLIRVTESGFERVPLFVQ
ncbi:adenine deaminase [Paenibacillus sp. NEAU-GSW1]|uniref:adenine deaminase n=1 Tax=Paenibacillus sp. NEAU-GSW1 TaxID=2682486 RepID=UPI0012E1B157|nr:adenine deaminase C-terminal domain-containing protein [Paenibacillus sp. NEAU-GSW1]MUT68235.1 amidohydrolase family protein [Paenibacillus sp. NEAU-GSW1]